MTYSLYNHWLYTYIICIIIRVTKEHSFSNKYFIASLLERICIALWQGEALLNTANSERLCYCACTVCACVDVCVCLCESVSMYVDARCMCKYISRINPNHSNSEAPKTAQPAFQVSSIALDNTHGSDISKARGGGSFHSSWRRQLNGNKRFKGLCQKIAAIEPNISFEFMGYCASPQRACCKLVWVSQSFASGCK